MRTKSLIDQIKKLPLQKKIYLVEKTINSIRKQEELKQLQKAVDSIKDDYTHEKELTIFTNLDFEDFYETR